MVTSHNALRRTAVEVRRYRNVARLTKAAIGLLSFVLVLTYVVSVLYGRYGSFTVTVSKFDQLKYSLSLSETELFEEPVSRLNCAGTQDVINISGATLPKDLDAINGPHSGKNYIAYTFYCKNTGNSEVEYQYELYIANATLGIDAAARVRLYVNGEMEEFAKTRSDGTGPEPGTTEFLTATTIVRRNVPNFKPGDVTKFTVVIWLEGDDPECVDNVLGGVFKVDMAMSILSTGEEADT